MSKLSSLVSGVGWGTVSIATVTMLQLVFMAVMARLLEPADFGLVAIANVALRFYSYFAQMGVTPALIQKETVGDGDVRAALALSLGVSAFFFLLALLTADLVEHYFEIKSLASVMRVLALNFIISGFSAVPLGLIRRNNAFKALAVIEIISYVMGYGVVGLGAAFYGAGVWSLVAAFLSQTLLSAILGYSVIRHPLALKHTKEQRNHLIGYGGRYSVIGFIEFLTSNIDSLVVGKLMGATVAGYYNRSLLLANLPVQNPTKVLTQVLFPIMSSMSNNHDKQSNSLQLSTLLVGSYAFAVGLGISVAAPDIVLVLLGNKWLESIPLLQILAISVGPIYLANVMGVTLDSMAQLSIKLRVQLVIFVLLVVFLFFVVPSGDVAGVAMAVVATFWVRLWILGLVVIRLLKIPVVDVFKIILCIAVITAATGVLIFIASHIAFAGSSVVIRLFAEILFGVIGLGVGMFLSRHIVSRLPAVVILAGRMPVLARLLPK